MLSEQFFIYTDCSLVGNFYFLSGKMLFGTTVGDDEAQNCDIK